MATTRSARPRSRRRPGSRSARSIATSTTSTRSTSRSCARTMVAAYRETIDRLTPEHFIGRARHETISEAVAILFDHVLAGRSSRAASWRCRCAIPGRRAPPRVRAAGDVSGSPPDRSDHAARARVRSRGVRIRAVRRAMQMRVRPRRCTSCRRRSIANAPARRSPRSSSARCFPGSQRVSVRPRSARRWQRSARLPDVRRCANPGSPRCYRAVSCSSVKMTARSRRAPCPCCGSMRSFVDERDRAVDLAAHGSDVDRGSVRARPVDTQQ